MKAALIMSKCGPSVRIYDETGGTMRLISYAWHKWAVPSDVSADEYLRAKWTRFARLCDLFIKDFALLVEKEGKFTCVFRKGNWV